MMSQTREGKSFKKERMIIQGKDDYSEDMDYVPALTLAGWMNLSCRYHLGFGKENNRHPMYSTCKKYSDI